MLKFKEVKAKVENAYTVPFEYNGKTINLRCNKIHAGVKVARISYADSKIWWEDGSFTWIGNVTWTRNTETDECYDYAVLDPARNLIACE